MSMNMSTKELLIDRMPKRVSSIFGILRNRDILKEFDIKISLGVQDKNESLRDECVLEIVTESVDFNDCTSYDYFEKWVTELLNSEVAYDTMKITFKKSGVQESYNINMLSLCAIYNYEEVLKSSFQHHITILNKKVYKL